MHIGPACADHEAALRLEQDRQWTKHVENTASHWIYVQDEGGGEILGCAEWLFFDKNPFSPELTRMTLDNLPEGEVREFTEHIVNQIYAPRLQWIRRRHAGRFASRVGKSEGLTEVCPALNLMGVHPAFRNRGIGSMLTEWGMPTIDQMGLESLIEASPGGRWVYEKFGYRFIMAISMDTEHRHPSDSWKTYQRLFGHESFHVMWRPPHGDWSRSRSPWESMQLHSASQLSH